MLVGLGRTQSYQAARLKQIPPKRVNGIRLVERKPWDRQVKRLLGSKPKAVLDSIPHSTLNHRLTAAIDKLSALRRTRSLVE